MKYIDRQQAERLRALLRSFPAVLSRERRRLSPDIEIIPWSDVTSGQIELF
jgi:hypothetical protein